MGGCCCTSNSNEATGNYPLSEEQEPPIIRATAPVLSTGLLVDTNLDTSVPDTFQPPPAPIPYETYGGRPPTTSGSREGSECVYVVALGPTNAESVEDINSGSTLKTKVKNLESGEKGETDIELEASKETEDEKSDELKKSSNPFIPPLIEEDDTCPICLEEYDMENPKIMTKCDHHFHLACILEWMERSDACPVCDQEMVFSSSFEG